MSGLRSTSGVPPALAGTATSPSSGQGPVAPASPATPAGQESGLPAGTAPPKAAAPVLSEDMLVNAIVMAKSTSENVILHTAFGNFRITTPTPLTVGSHIVFEVTELQDIIMARLLVLNGKDLAPPLEVRLLPTVEKALSTAEGYIKAGQLHPAELKSGLQNLTAAISPGVKSGPEPTAQGAPAQTTSLAATLPPSPKNATLVAPNGATGVQADGVPRANPQGLAIYQRYHSPSLTPAQGHITGTPATGQAPAAAPNQIFEAEIFSARARESAGNAADRTSLASGEKINLIVRPQQSGGTLQPRGDIFQGTVIALARMPNSNGISRVTLQTPMGMISYNTSAPPTAGTNVQFAIADEIAVFPLPGSEIQQPGAHQPKLALMGEWHNLREALNLVARQDPIVAQTVISQMMPQANAQLSNALLFFMAALNLGSIEKWLGQEFTQALRAAGRTPLLQALDDDFSTFSRLQNEAGGQDWKSLNFPFFDGSNLRQVRMFYRQRQGNDDMTAGEETTRFVIELNLSKSGQMQLDGLFKKQQFNLAIRSHKDVPEDMRLHIGKLFNEHMEISGLKGQLIFKTTTPFPIDPLAEWESKKEPESRT